MKEGQDSIGRRWNFNSNLHLSFITLVTRILLQPRNRSHCVKYAKSSTFNGAPLPGLSGPQFSPAMDSIIRDAYYSLAQPEKVQARLGD